MTGQIVQFVAAGEYALDVEERLIDLVDCLVELGQRLDNLEQMAVEAAAADPFLARLDALENRLARLELRQRRPVPLTVHQTGRLDANDRALFNELQRIVNRLDRDLNQRMAALDQRFSRVATRAYRERKAAEAKQGA